MKFTVNWLKDYLDTDASLEAICERLTAIGLEVESVEDRAAMLAPFIIARIVTAKKHPQADRLRVCSVDTGGGIIQVVCGAPNAAAGLVTVLARPGDVIPETGQALKAGIIRGVESQGMMCAAAELLMGGESHGIIELPADAPIGGNFAAYAGYNDPVIEINLTPNRPDCAGVRGIARDLAAAGIGTLLNTDCGAPSSWNTSAATVNGTAESSIKVSLDFPPEQQGHCSLFMGRQIRNIHNVASPEWMQRRLTAIGLRPISALVDITNYLTFDMARPLHVFDADKVRGNLRVHPATGGEAFAALNGKEYVLEAGMTAISDDSGAVLSLAGIMGGASTGCTVETTSVFIEAAAFDAGRTARTGRALQLQSDARYRFERGVDPSSAAAGIEAATRLITAICATNKTVVSTVVTSGSLPATPRVVSYNPKRCLTLGGLDVAISEQKRVLEALGFKVEDDNKDSWRITAPSFRSDIDGAADIVEEIARIVGYDAIPACSLPRKTAVTATAIDAVDRKASLVRRTFAARGLCEAVTWSFMAEGLAQKTGGGGADLQIVNPISADLNAMRPSLVGNLLSAIRRNADRGFPDIGLFEVGAIYRDATPEGQRLAACAVRTGTTPRHWQQPARAVNVFDAKADALAALEAAGMAVSGVQVTTDAPSWYHPGRSGCLRLGTTLLAHFGEVHPALLSELGLDGCVVVACEVVLSDLPVPKAKANGAARPLLHLEELQPLTRDYAFVVSRDTAAEKVVKAVKMADRNLISAVTVFDVYEGANVGADKKSLAIGVTIQPSEHTLTDAELDALSARITAAVTKATGGEVRKA